ncbi:PLP-dependent aminotransferase family protein [Nonomuraea soli]|uniref:GntR family transcriptional regulator/MocR family aminotransferase n=1 Tax=Nonomuraea soli TaxID=1032476 RepID=A0A7W0CIE3_9ACTN|nr:PLP-dependent aminotransferase family protein [Nonomuraea soli]MBA2891720.1 GntR family transcriptional regulator/MocR family aminotransferase [Nonomuraea soli]
MEIHISLDGRGDLAASIYRQLLAAIVDGRLRAGERLPPTRELARRLDVSRNTVGAAYERLVADGFLVGRAGAGTFVAKEIRKNRHNTAPRGVVQPRPAWRGAQEPTTLSPRLPYDFTVGVPDLTLFPLDSWRRLVGQSMRATGYTGPEGHPALREAVARHIGVSRSVRASAGDVLVTQGAQQALDLIGRILIEPGATVAVEEPGYPPARRLFAALGARVEGVQVDGEGIRVDRLPGQARLVYVTPSHQFPLGTPMSLARRTELLSWAARKRAVVIEDDYDTEFRYGDRPLEPLQSLDRDGRVIYVGSFSKTLLPMLRVGFLIAPASLQPALRAAKQLTDWHGDPTTQAALARFIDEGLLARHIRKATKIYAARHQRIAEILGRVPGLTVVPSAAGLHLCARLDPGARAHTGPGLAVERLEAYCGELPVQPGLVLGYGSVSVSGIDEGLRLLSVT